MITLKRGPIPAVLAKYASRWQVEFAEQLKTKPKTRPQSARYAHVEVKTALRRMSCGKCFFCERKLGEHEDQVDHHIDVAEQPDLAFDWNNLALSCEGCNNKKAPNTEIPVVDCVEPCNSAIDPADHLMFDGECIQARGNSERGSLTIKKYRLFRGDLDLARAKVLNVFHKLLDVVRKAQIAGGGRDFTTDERDLLKRFANDGAAFSLMMTGHIRDLNL